MFVNVSTYTSIRHCFNNRGTIDNQYFMNNAKSIGKMIVLP